jgi:hypothetical protein
MLEKFDPNKHLIQLKGKDYLQVMWRLVWFREAYPHGTIHTEVVHLDLENNIAVFKATVTDGEGGSATGHGSESMRDFLDYIEKAETKSVGRALAALGFGTQFAPELEEGNRIVDAPVERQLTLGQVKHMVQRAGLAKDAASWQAFVVNTLGAFVESPTPEQLSQLARKSSEQLSA